MDKIMENNASLITEIAFKLILDSESGEGFTFNETTIDASGAVRLKNIEKDVILSFLEQPDTKVFVEKAGDRNYLIASNQIAGESIRIKGLADHYLALLDIVNQASKVKEQIAMGQKPKLLSH